MEEPKGLAYLRELRASQLQSKADRLSDFRYDVAPALAAGLVANGRSWQLTALVMGIEVTDAMDGPPARQAAELRGAETSEEGSERDHRADKRLVNYLLGGLGAREAIEGHYLSAGFIALAATANHTRDIRMRQLREEAREQGKSTKAIPINKVKTGILMTAAAVGSSPLADKKVGRIIQNGLIGIGVGTGIIGLKIFERHLSKQN